MDDLAGCPADSPLYWVAAALTVTRMRSGGTCGPRRLEPTGHHLGAVVPPVAGAERETARGGAGHADPERVTHSGDLAVRSGRTVRPGRPGRWLTRVDLPVGSNV